MSTIALIGTLADEPRTGVYGGVDVVELHVQEYTAGADLNGQLWVDDEPLTWVAYVREDQALVAMLRKDTVIRVDGYVRNLWGRIAIDNARISRPLSPSAPDYARPI